MGVAHNYNLNYKVFGSHDLDAICLFSLRLSLVTFITPTSMLAKSVNLHILLFSLTQIKSPSCHLSPSLCYLTSKTGCENFLEGTVNSKIKWNKGLNIWVTGYPMTYLSFDKL